MFRNSTLVAGLLLFALLTFGALFLSTRVGAQAGSPPIASPAPSVTTSTASPEPTPDVSDDRKKVVSKAAAVPPVEPRMILSSIGIILLLTLLSAVFSMAETALTSVRRSRVEQLVEENRAGAVAVRKLQDDPPRYVATVQAGITLLGFAAAASAAVAIAPALLPLLGQMGLSPRIAHNIAVVTVVIIVSFIALVFGEIAPKALAMQSPDIWALRLAPLVNFCAILFTPLNTVALGLSNALVRPFGAKARFETPMITREEFEQIVVAGAEKGEFDREERAIIENVIDFSETLVRAVMTPRIDMSGVPITATLAETLQTVMASGHSRLPVYENTTDNIIGIVHAKDLLSLFARGDASVGFDLRQVIREPFFVPESRRVADLLAEMRRSKNQIAVVQDEYGGTAGIVTLEDLLEEIVGDIRDEYDVDEPEMRVLSTGVSLIDGRMSIADVNDRLGTDLSDEEYTTLGGLVFGMLGHEPAIGERVRQDGLEFVIEALDRGRIKSVRAIRIADREAAESEAEPAATVGAGVE